MYSIIPLPALNDNYIWIIKAQNGSSCICIDPGEAAPVVNFLDQNNLTLKAILITHHHYDHTDGITELYERYKPKIFSPDNIHHDSNIVYHNTIFNLPGINKTCTVSATPGHTLDHVIYNIDNLLFTGDTLFSAGCGRIYEGTYSMMHESLSLIASFPDDYKIYCGHEYTKQNLMFASQVDPGNSLINDKLNKVCSMGDNYVTLPSTIAEEKLINPFLRCGNSDIIQNAQKKCSKTLQGKVDVFSEIRKWKDNF